MRIDRIDIIRVLNPFKHPFQTSFTKFENRDALLVKIYSEGLDAVSRGDFIEKGKKVIVIKAEGSYLVVKKADAR